MTTAEQPPPEGRDQPPQAATSEGADDSDEAQDPDPASAGDDSGD